MCVFVGAFGFIWLYYFQLSFEYLILSQFFFFFLTTVESLTGELFLHLTFTSHDLHGKAHVHVHRLTTVFVYTVICAVSETF